MTTDQVLLGVGLIVVLAVGSQVMAGRPRIPALIILLPAGFIAGALTSDVYPERLVGVAFPRLVSLAGPSSLTAPAATARTGACE